MKPLRPLTEPPLFVQRFIAIRNAMDDSADGPRAIISANHAAIVGRYTALRTAVANQTLKNLSPSVVLAPIKDALQETYSGNRKPLRQLKKDIKAAQREGTLTICPMCKMYSPRTSDHYLPQGKFPEYAVHPLNLVPCCQTCNGKKLEAWLNADGERICLYLYADPIPQTAFICCSLTPSVRNHRNVGITFKLLKPNGISQARWDHIVRHFDRLKLIDRYNEDGNDELSEALANAKDYLSSGGPEAGVRDYLMLGAARFVKMHGKSYWRAELRRQLAIAADLLTWIQASGT